MPLPEGGAQGSGRARSAGVSSASASTRGVPGVGLVSVHKAFLVDRLAASSVVGRRSGTDAAAGRFSGMEAGVDPFVAGVVVVEETSFVTF